MALTQLVNVHSSQVMLPTAIGGFVSDALYSVYVDALGDFSAGQPGCSEAINAKLDALLGTTDSVYHFGTSKFIKVIFGCGTYALNGTVLRSGVKWVGQGDYATRLIPTNGDYDAMFITVGTKPFDFGGVRVWERLMYWSFEDFIFGQYWEDRSEYPAGVHAFDVKFSSYGYFSNVRFRRIRAEALGFSECFDTRFSNVSIMYCGVTSPTGDHTYSLRMDNVGSDDATNACHFDRLHMEANYAGMHLTKCRHMIFSNPKFERDDTSHRLDGCQGLVFSSAEQTWNREDIPQFAVQAVTGSSPSDSWGVKFDGGQCISSNGIGLYFTNTGQAGPLLIYNTSARGVSTIADGVNISVVNLDTYDCGPTILKLGGNCKLSNSKLYACRAAPVGDGTDDTVIVSGSGTRVQGVEFTGLAKSGAVPNGAFVNVSAVPATDVTNCTFGGYRQYGVRQATSNYAVRDNAINLANNHVTALTNLVSANYELVNKNSRGLGISELDSEVITVAAGATANVKVAGGTRITLRVIPSGGVAASGECLVDASNAGLQILANTNPAVLDFTAPVPGSGKLHLSHVGSGTSALITNNTAVSCTVVLVYLTLVP